MKPTFTQHPRKAGRVTTMAISIVAVGLLGGAGAWYIMTRPPKEAPPVEAPKEEEMVEEQSEEEAPDVFAGRRNAHGVFYIPIDEVIAKKPPEEPTKP